MTREDDTPFGNVALSVSFSGLLRLLPARPRARPDRVQGAVIAGAGFDLLPPATALRFVVDATLAISVDAAAQGADRCGGQFSHSSKARSRPANPVRVRQVRLPVAAGPLRQARFRGPQGPPRAW